MTAKKKGKTRSDWRPKVSLTRFFTPTKDTANEWGKARYKNINLPLLQYMYHGDELEPLHCLVSNAPGFIDFPCLVNNISKQRFNIDFNHIRQRQNGNRQAGISVDKCKSPPSAIFRSQNLYDKTHDLLEFMCIMPISQEYHSYISQDSSLGHITLENYSTQHWPWFLKSSSNYYNLTNQFKIDVTYEWFIEHLSDINHLPIRKRLAINAYNPYRSPANSNHTTVLELTP
jgi:hypothetical protein